MSRLARGTQPWNQALTNYAKTKDPSTLSQDVLLTHDSKTVTIWDAFKKAQYHALVLPRLPYTTSATTSSNAPTLASNNGKLTMGLSSSGTIPPSHLRSLRDLLSSPYASEVLQSLRTASNRAIELIQDKMRRDYGGKCWEVRRGFHAIPSMEHVHLHLISSDLVSDRLKNKKHYLSFHPSHGFWLDLDEVETYVASKRLPRPESHYESLLKSSLVSFRDGETYANVPKLKEHLEHAWRQELAALPAQDQTAAAGGHKRKASTSPIQVGKLDIQEQADRTSPTAKRRSTVAPPAAQDSDTETEPET